jgi:WD40 repeat protein
MLLVAFVCLLAAGAVYLVLHREPPSIVELERPRPEAVLNLPELLPTDRGEGIVFIDGQELSPERWKEEVALGEGEHVIVVKQGEKVLDERRLTVPSGERVKLRLLPKKEVPSVRPGKSPPAQPAGPPPPPVSFAGHKGAVLCIAFAPNHDPLATGGEDRTVRLWDVTTRQEQAVLRGHGARVERLAFAPSGKALASGDAEGVVKVWEIDQRRLERTLEAHTQEVTSLAFSGDGRALASAGRDGLVKCWDLDTGNELASLSGHGAGAVFLAFSADGRWLATGGEDRAVRVWDFGKRKEKFPALRRHAGGVTSLAFSADGLGLFSAGADGLVHHWEVATGRLVETLDYGKRLDQIECSRDGKRLAAVSNGRLKIFDRVGGKERRTRPTLPPVHALALAADGRSVAVVKGRASDAIDIWELEDAEEEGLPDIPEPPSRPPP